MPLFIFAAVRAQGRVAPDNKAYFTWLAAFGAPPCTESRAGHRFLLKSRQRTFPAAAHKGPGVSPVESCELEVAATFAAAVTSRDTRTRTLTTAPQTRHATLTLYPGSRLHPPHEGVEGSSATSHLIIEDFSCRPQGFSTFRPLTSDTCVYPALSCVWMEGFEPPTPDSRSQCSTKLNYIQIAFPGYLGVGLHTTVPFRFHATVCEGDAGIAMSVPVRSRTVPGFCGPVLFRSVDMTGVPIVEPAGIEPATFAMPWRRSTN